MHTEWDDLNRSPFDRPRIRRALEQDFGQVCAYCEQLCQPPTRSSQSPNDATIDHFRPRHLFPDQWLDWLNLIYACRRCNDNKSGSWPGYDDALTNRVLAAAEPRYTPVTEYVNPNAAEGRQPAHEFFRFDVANGEIAPADQLDPVEWSTARRTIMDIDLNDSKLGENDPNHLWNQRVEHLDWMLQKLDALEDFDSKVKVILEFMLPNKPFSGFISAYFSVRFPLLGQLFQRY